MPTRGAALTNEKVRQRSGTVDAGAQSSMPSLHTIVSGVILDLNSENE